jgi:hypothetical protein
MHFHEAYYSCSGCRTGQAGWESIPELLKKFTNTGSVYEKRDLISHASKPIRRSYLYTTKLYALLGHGARFILWLWKIFIRKQMYTWYIHTVI